ncbi:MAG: hypothetical protein ACI8TP_003278 [Acidimicrobiales bacterium]|jgi:hypothetical protein
MAQETVQEALTTGDHDNEETDASMWWRLWAMAALAHLFGASLTEWNLRVPASLFVGFAALTLLARPDDRRIRAVLAASILVLVWVEAPFLGNHWLLAGLISLAALISRPWAAGWLTRAGPGCRVILLLFYSFAAFAKLNDGFFDSVDSCARFFANQSLEFWQLPSIAGESPLARMAIYVSVAIELSVPVLLLMRPTRRFGVLLAVSFHLVLALDLRQHFFDFTLVLVPLFLLFLPAGALSDFERRFRVSRDLARRAWSVVFVFLVLGFSLPVPSAFRGMAILATWILWLILVVLVAEALLRTPWSPQKVSWKLQPLSLLIVALTMANGLAPYLELKTATGFNMYSNLTSGGGETNHLIVPATAGLRSEGSDLATVLETSDPDLAEYINSGFGLPFVNLTDYLADHLEAALTFERNGETVVVERAGDHPELLQRQSVLVEKFLFLRAVPLGSDSPCQNDWLPAR